MMLRHHFSSPHCFSSTAFSPFFPRPFHQQHNDFQTCSSFTCNPILLRSSRRHRLRSSRLDACLPIPSLSLSSSSSPSRTPTTVHILPSSVAQRIASGEVAHDLTSIVRELVDNSLDANARCISIDVDHVAHIVVCTDDGYGIPAHILPRLGHHPHFTSKLSTVQQLDHVGIQTLGFRGLALWAIMSVARVLTLESRQHGQNSGFDVKGNPVAMSVGTRVVFMYDHSAVNGSKTGNQNIMRRVRKLLFHFALAHPQVTFRLTKQGRSVWHRRPAVVVNNKKGEEIKNEEQVTIAHTLAQHLRIHHSVVHTDTRQFSITHPHLQLTSHSDSQSIPVTVTVAVVPTTTGNTNSLIMALNGRVLKLDTISPAIVRQISGAKTNNNTRSSSSTPTVFIHIHLPSAVVDWNVVPDKSRVRFRGISETQLAGMVATIIVQLLRPENALSKPSEHLTKLLTTSRQASISSSPSSSSLSSTSSSDMTMAMTGNVFGNVRVVAQLLSTYILVEHAGGIILIEQHVADERAIYEELCSCFKLESFVPLAEPIRLILHQNPDNDELASFRLSTLGFDVDVAEDNDNDNSITLLIQSIPKALLSMSSNFSIMTETLRYLVQHDVSVERAAASIACKLAVKNGRALEQKEMQRIVKRLLACENGHTCPHGRPIFHQLGTRQLARLFRRSWMPDKMSPVKRSGNNRIDALRDEGKSWKDFMYGTIEE